MQMRHMLKWLKKVDVEEHVLVTFILVLMESGTESHGKLFLSVKICSCLCWYFWGDSSEIYFLREQLF